MRHMRAWLLVLLAACGAPEATARHVVGPDGSPDWWSISCQADQGACLERAGQRCPSGYSIIGRNEREASSTAILVKCKGPSAPVPVADPDCRDKIQDAACRRMPELFGCAEQRRAGLARCNEQEERAKAAGVVDDR